MFAVEGCLLSGVPTVIALVLAYNMTPSSSGKYVICSTRLTIGRYLDFCSFILRLPPVTPPPLVTPPPSLHYSFQLHYEMLEQAENKANFLHICVTVEPRLTDTPEQQTHTT